MIPTIPFSTLKPPLPFKPYSQCLKSPSLRLYHFISFQYLGIPQTALEQNFLSTTSPSWHSLRAAPLNKQINDQSVWLSWLERWSHIQYDLTLGQGHPKVESSSLSTDRFFCYLGGLSFCVPCSVNSHTERDTYIDR